MRTLPWIIAAMLFAQSATAQVIDFESTPSGGSPTDNLALALNDGYTVGTVTVTFGFDQDLNGTPESQAVFEQVGADGTDGYARCSGTSDTAASGFGAQLGNFFLRADTNLQDFGKFIITYSGGTVTAAGGEIWDIDGFSGGTESYRVQAFDSSNTLLATVDSPIGDGGCAGAVLDGKPWVFQFSGLSAGIAKITIDFTGSKQSGIGLAFNNFDATGVLVAVEDQPWGNVKRLYR